MLQASKSSSLTISAQASSTLGLHLVQTGGSVRLGALETWLQISLVYALIEAALWMPAGPLYTFWILAAVLCILLFVRIAPFSARDMGIAKPGVSAIAWTLLGGMILAALIPLLAWVLRGNLDPTHRLPFGQACLYAVWALMQQFILQSFFFVRFETLLDSRPAVLVTALLFGAAHIPNYVLAFSSFAAALFFCEMFRRYRNIFPLGVVHAGLGLLMASNFSDSVLHHMRVGIGFVRFHP